MIIDTGSKAFWLGAFFICVIVEAFFKILAGLGNAPKPTKHTWTSVAEGMLALVIGLGWWFAT